MCSFGFDFEPYILGFVLCNSLQTTMHVPVLGNVAQETLYALLPEVLRYVSLRAARSLWAQGNMPLLQQLEDQRGPPKMPLISKSLIRNAICFFLLIIQLPQL